MYLILISINEKVLKECDNVLLTVFENKFVCKSITLLLTVPSTKGAYWKKLLAVGLGVEK